MSTSRQNHMPNCTHGNVRQRANLEFSRHSVFAFIDTNQQVGPGQQAPFPDVERHSLPARHDEAAQCRPNPSIPVQNQSSPRRSLCSCLPCSLPGLRQPAAAFVSAACCGTLGLLVIIGSCHVERRPAGWLLKAAAGCRSPECCAQTNHENVPAMFPRTQISHHIDCVSDWRPLSGAVA